MLDSVVLFLFLFALLSSRVLFLFFLSTLSLIKNIIILVEGDIEERRRVYNHFCTGRGAFSRGPPDGLDEDLVVTDCEALWLLRERLVVVKDKVYVSRMGF